MKTRMAIITALALAALCCSAKQQIVWLGTVYDYGAFGEDEAVAPAVFKFVNTGDEDVAIVQASATCGCTTPEYDAAAIAPGDTGVVTVTFNPQGRPGRFSKHLYVRTSASKEREKLMLKGVVIGNDRSVGLRFPADMGPLKLHTGAVMLGRVPAGGAKSEFLDVYNQSRDTIRPAVKDVPPYLQVAVKPDAVPPGEMASFNFYFRGDKCKEWGIVTDSVTILPTGPGGPEHSLPVVAIVEEDFSKLTPKELASAPVLAMVGDRIDLGIVPKDAAKPVKAKMTILNRGKDPLVIRRICSQDPAVTARATSTVVKPGKHAAIEVTFDPAVHSADDIINTRITVIANDPSAPTRTIRIVGARR